MSADDERWCELCDLRLQYCVHGLERRRRKKGGRSKATKSARQGGASSQRTSAPTSCAQCGKPRYGRYRLCRECGINSGWLLCRSCGKLFSPDAALAKGMSTKGKKGKCPTCRQRPRGSVWTTASAGAPTLGGGR